LDFRYGGVMYSQTAQLTEFTGNGVATLYNDRKPFIVPNSVNAVTDANGKTTYVENKAFVGQTLADPTTTPNSQGNQSDATYEWYRISTSPASAFPYTVFDRSFLKLRDVNFTYTIPQKWISKIRASSASIGVYARNILLWTPKSNVYIDPEASNYGNDITSQLGEFATAPLSQQYGLILKLVF
jgi:hypothetical protein